MNCFRNRRDLFNLDRNQSFEHCFLLIKNIYFTVSRPEAQCFKSVCFCPRGFKLEEDTQLCVPLKGVKLETMGFSGFNSKQVLFVQLPSLLI